jgi:hypothetical protein
MPGFLLSIPVLFVSSALYAQVIINEIVYNDGPNFDSGDWVELFNGSETQVDVGNWVVKDGNDANMYTIPAGTIIQRYGYLVVYSSTDFTAVYPGVANKVGPSGLGFKNDEEVRLFDDTGEKVDEVDYEVGVDGWPNADGNDHSIELLYPYEDNNEGVNWTASSNPGGSPGTINPGAVGINVESHSRLPNAPDDNDTVEVVLQVKDAFATLTSVVINVRYNGGTYAAGQMGTPEAGKYTASLPPTNDGTVVEYYFDIYNDAGQSLTRWWTGTNIPYLYRVDNNPVNTGFVINEIMYNSSNIWIQGTTTDSYEYLEIFSTHTTSMDISYWRLEDSGNKYRMPAPLALPGRGYLVIADSTQALLDVYGPAPTNAVMVEITDLGLRNSGETIRWQNANGQKVDEVTYSDSFPWPVAPDGNGPSLELIHWTLDNSLPGSWDASMGEHFFGTPGQLNSVVPEPSVMLFAAAAILCAYRNRNKK